MAITAVATAGDSGTALDSFFATVFAGDFLSAFLAADGSAVLVAVESGGFEVVGDVAEAVPGGVVVADADVVAAELAGFVVGDAAGGVTAAGAGVAGCVALGCGCC